MARSDDFTIVQHNLWSLAAVGGKLVGISLTLWFEDCVEGENTVVREQC